jgi:hypothetical protein
VSYAAPTSHEEVVFPFHPTALSVDVGSASVLFFAFPFFIATFVLTHPSLLPFAYFPVTLFTAPFSVSSFQFISSHLSLFPFAHFIVFFFN